MTEIKWNDRFNIGVSSIDKAHQRLFSIVRKMVDFNDDEKDRQWVCTEGIKYFKNYALKHFADEEAYMKSIDYDGYETHKRIHDDLRDKTLPALEEDMEESGYSPESIQHFLGICIGWLTGHIMLEDHAITGRVANKWIYNTYVDKESKRIQVFFVLEERLVLHTVGQLLNVQFKKMDKVVADAAKLIAQQYMKRIAMYYKSIGMYTLEKTNMLTEDQMVQDFRIEYPKYSLLFNTGKGYMAVCIKNS